MLPGTPTSVSCLQAAAASFLPSNSNKEIRPEEVFMRSDLGLSFLGAAVGAGATFLLDPQTGKRRRALLRDKMGSFSRQTTIAIDKTARDLRNRAYGTVMSIKSGHPMRGGLAVLNANWPPAVRLMVGVTGGMMTAVGAAKGRTEGKVLVGVGIGSLTLAVTNFSIRGRLKKSTRGKFAAFWRRLAA
jgi:hypothetical protein